MNIFKIAYKTVRESSSEIYGAFGFKHLSDATQYYVHPDNQSYKGTTTLCQPIGEAISFLSLLLSSIVLEDVQQLGDFYTSVDGNSSFIEIDVPEDFRDKHIVQDNIYKYKSYLNGDECIVGAYDQYGSLIEGNMEHIKPLYKLLPAFCSLLCQDMQSNPDFNTLLLEYVFDPSVDTFVNIHEDFYQTHKLDEIELIYEDLSLFNKDNMISFSKYYQIIKENKAEVKLREAKEIITFPDAVFSTEQKVFCPNLPAEFVMPDSLNSVCTAIAKGDATAVLLHGTAGTGKTMSCKLMCQAIGLPLVETINCTENLDEFVLGKFIPQEDKISFKESYVTKAIREGGAVVFEEINFAKPGYLAFLNSLLDDNGFVRLDNGDVVKRNKNFRFFATMNRGYWGTKELNQALYNRFNIILEMDELSDEAISRMLIARVPECKEVIDKILGVYHKLKKKIAMEELDVVISARNLENWVRLAKYEGYILAAEKTIIPIAKSDRIFEKTIRDIIILYKWK